MATELLPLKLPRLLFVDDYHEFHHIQSQLRDLTGTKRVKVEEVGFGATGTYYEKYIGIVYIRKDADYHRLVKEAKEWPQIEKRLGVVAF